MELLIIMPALSALLESLRAIKDIQDKEARRAIEYNKQALRRNLRSLYFPEAGIVGVLRSIAQERKVTGRDRKT
ncbi:MAG: hypothetical protein ACR2RE_03305, partial [Geminicoccaceae bacterium]